MEILHRLRRLNPALPLYSVLDPEFAPYGRVWDVKDVQSLTDGMGATPIPETGNCYVASDPALEALEAAAQIGRAVFGGMPIQAGYCNGRGFTLNAEEYHKCSEVNLTDTGLVLLLALPEDLQNGKLDSSRIAGFYLPPGVPVELHPRVLHFAPCRIREEGFRCLVVLERGTNEPLTGGVNTGAPGEEALLWMRNKWLICHPESPQAAKGAYIGITGDNLTLKI